MIREWLRRMYFRMVGKRDPEFGCPVCGFDPPQVCRQKRDCWFR